MKKKPEYYYNQSAVLPFKKIDGDYFILLITSRNQKRWIIPKGIVEESLSSRNSAEKEAWEEAGITGKTAKRSIGCYKHEKWGGTCVVEVFPLKVNGESEKWDEMHFRQRKWFQVDEAIKKLKNKQLKLLIKKYFRNNSK